jgi:hypothetical protein
MHSILASIGRDADMVVCAQRGYRGRNWRGFLGSNTYELSIASESGLSSIGPQASQRQEERQGPKRSVDLN